MAKFVYRNVSWKPTNKQWVRGVCKGNLSKDETGPACMPSFCVGCVRHHVESENPRLFSPIFLLPCLSCLCPDEWNINSFSSPEIPLSILLGERSSPNIFTENGCVRGVSEWMQAYLLAHRGLWLKERQAWVESPGTFPAYTTFIPEARHTILILCVWGPWYSFLKDLVSGLFSTINSFKQHRFTNKIQPINHN